MSNEAIKRLVIVFICIFVVTWAAAQTVVINEFMTHNAGFFADPDGDYSGWVELYNAGTTPVDLQGWALSNDAGQPFQWVFPTAMLGPGDFLLIWTSGKDRAAQPFMTYDFDGGTHQGWTDLTVIDPEQPEGPRHWGISPSVFPHQTHSGSGAVGQNLVGGTQDSAHPTLRLRSPEFTLSGQGDLTAWLCGGTGSGTVAGMSASALQADSSGPGFQGIALLNLNTDMYVLAASKTSNGDHWQQVGFDQGQLATLDQDATYALELIDAGHGGWGWVAMDTVSIAGIPTEGSQLDLHTNFEIDPDGSPLLLTTPDGTPVDAVDTIALPRNVSYGRTVDADAIWSYFMVPTPAASNNDAVAYDWPVHFMTQRDEPFGRSSRRTGMTISEIMYHPAPREDERDLEFVELHNTEPTVVDLGGWRLTGSIDYTFPPDTQIQAGTLLVVARAPQDMQAVYGDIPVMPDGYAGRLKRASGEVELRHRNGALLLSTEYGSSHPWPAAATGAGHSLVLSAPSYGQDCLQAWRASTYKGGSPGEKDPPATDALQYIRINEFLAHTDEPLRDYIELYNHSVLAVDLSGALLSDKPDDPDRFVIPDGTILEPGGFVVFYEAPDRDHPGEDEFGFGLRASGEGVYLVDPDNTRVIDAIAFGPQLNGVSMGRYPDGGEEFYLLAELTPGAPNGRPRQSEIVINEIMFNPITNLDEDCYIELYNLSNEWVDLSDWRFVDGISFVIPDGTQIAPDGYLVVAKDRQRLLSRYPHLNTGNTVGDFGGRLANSGERIALAKPVERSEEPTMYAVVDEVHYRDGGRWGQWANRDGSSLELIDRRSNNRLAANWTHSDETHKSEWVTVEHTGVLDHGWGDADALYILMPSSGMCLVDGIEVFAEDGINQVPNADFESGMDGWIAQGNHVQTAWHPEEGYNSDASLRVVATGGGCNGANRVRVNLDTNFSPGQTVTIRAKVRWLAGHRDIILTLRGNYLEAVGHLHIPTDLGTPGLPNSVQANNIGPAIYNVRHFPTLPQDDEPIIITGQACDPDGISSVTLFYRLDPSSQLHAVQMFDDGQGDDLLAGDGIYTATIPGQPAGTLIAYHIEAIDAHAQSASSTYPDDISEYEALVRVGEAEIGNFPIYRMWFTQETLDEWTSREILSNQRLSGTLVYGSRVIHNIGARYRGSPFIRPSYGSPVSGGATAYSFHVPRDNRLLGAREFNLDGLEQPHRDGTLQREKMTFWLADKIGLPFSYQTYLYVFVNGNRRGLVYTDSQHVDSDYVSTWFPDDDAGEFFKIDDWFEFDDTPLRLKNTDATLGNFTTTGGEKKLARYRWNWNKRSNRWLDDDYSQLFQLVDAVNMPAGDDYTRPVEALVDIDQWMRIFAVRRAAADWDGYGYVRGKNTFTYKPIRDGWKMILWDLDFSLGGGSHPPDHCLFANTGDPVVVRMYNHPPFRRSYLRAFYDIVSKAMDPIVMHPVMDAQYDAFLEEGIYVESPQSIKSWIASRRNYIIGVLNNESSGTFAVTTHGGDDFITAESWLTLQGIAPLRVKTLTFNGRPYPVTWTSVDDWSVQIPLQPGANPILIEGLDSWDQPIQGAEASITVTYTGEAAAGENHLVINEIMYNPLDPGAKFVEIHNTSETHGFDLTGHRLRGVDFNFPEGTLIEPHGFLVITKNRFAFYTAYGSTIPVVGDYNGRLHPDGERLRLVRLATETEDEVILDEVTYGVVPPWPAAANGHGQSLQRIDPAVCGNHPGNWAAGSGQVPWQLVSITGITHPANPSNRVYIYLESAGEVYLDDLFLARGTVPQSGQNHIQNGGFEEPLDGTWVVSDNHAGSSITTSVKRSGSSSLHVVATSGGSTQGTAIWQDGLSLDFDETYTLSFWYLPDSNGTDLTVRLRYAGHVPSEQGIHVTQNVFGQSAFAGYTPGAKNSVQTILPPFEPLWINEIQPINTGEFTDSDGDAGAWVELYNAGDQAISLDGYHLSNDYRVLDKWAFPAGTQIGPGQFRIVWMDGQPQKTTDGEWYSNFAINPHAGSLVLSRRVDPINSLVDWLDYEGMLPGLSYGRFPDGSPETVQTFYVPTPGYANDNTGVPLLHYWHFNNLPSGTLTAVPADYSVNPGALITYPGSGTGYMDRVNDGTTLNVRTLEPAGYGLRVRNPSYTRELLLNLPTTGYQNIVLSYAVTRTSNGATRQSVYYRLSGIDPWILLSDAIEVTEDFQIIAIDFSDVPQANNNPEFTVRILFGGANALAATGNNRFDNITLEGLPQTGTNLPPQLVEAMPLAKAIEHTPIQINLSAYFTDPDGDTLTFTAQTQTDKPFVVHSTVSGNILTLVPLYRGDAIITVSAFDGHNPPVETTFRLLVYPAAQTLRLVAFSFDYWSEDNPEHAFPEGMLFLQSDTSDPGVDASLEYAYFIPHDGPDSYHADDIPDNVGYPYRTMGRSRINGLGDEGVSFINTGRDRDLGGVLTAIDTTGLEGIQISWFGGTIEENLRRYAIRLQYRLGIGGPFLDVLDDGLPVEYIVEQGSDGSGYTQEFDSIELPAAAVDQPYVQLLWRYYHLDGDSGPRAQLRLDDITVRSTLDIFEQLSLFAQWWLQTDCALPDHCGGADLNRDGTVDLKDFAILAVQW